MGSQTTLSASQRRDNLRGAFEVSTKLRGQRVLVVDDVYTTGATAQSLAASLKAAGVASVDWVALAKTP